MFVALLLPARLLGQSDIALAQAAENLLIFEYVTLIDGTGTPAQPNMTVMIAGNHIHAIAIRMVQDISQLVKSGWFGCRLISIEV